MVNRFWKAIWATVICSTIGALWFWQGCGWRARPTLVVSTSAEVAIPAEGAGGVRTTGPAMTAAPAVAANARRRSPGEGWPRLAPAESAVGRFQEWGQRYLAALPAERRELVAEGLALAVARRGEFKALIARDPREALRQAVPLVVRPQLPAEVIAELEERVEGRAQLRVYQSTPLDVNAPTQPPIVRFAELAEGETYTAYVYGRRSETMLWVPNASLHGVALDRQLAVSDSPLRRLEVGEIPEVGRKAIEICPVSGKTTLATAPTVPIEEATVALAVYGEIVYLCDGSHVAIFEEQLIQGEGTTGGPQRFTGLLPAAPSPSLGELRVLYIPLTFADQNVVPATEAKCYEVMREVADFYMKASFGRLTVMSTVTPPIKLPHTEAWYVQKDTSDGVGVNKEIDGLGLEHSAAREEARKLGFDSNDFDAVVVRLSGGPRPTGGWGGGTSVWVYGDWTSVVAHELGHCFGLAHANFWDTGGASAIGPGANAEYGNSFDVMGGGPFPKNHFNAQAKNQVKWMPTDYVQTVAASGTYRIHAFDQAFLDATKRYALKIGKDTQRTYWGEVRAQFDADNKWVANGLVLGWQWAANGGSNIQLIDTTPASPGGKNDAPIVVGQTFTDAEAGIHFTTIGVNDIAGERSVDVVVNLGFFPDNRAPTLALAASALNIPAGAAVTMTATAVDADGDELAYQWLSSDNTSASAAIIGPNGASFTRSFATAGQYVVTCMVSDMKGGRATRRVLVSVGNGNSRYFISGRIMLGAKGLGGVYVSTGTGNGVPSDSDGYYTIPNLAAGSYTVVPQLFGYEFTEGFNNGVLVGPNYTTANFSTELVATVALTASVPTATEAGVLPGKFTLTRTGPDVEAMDVRITAPAGTATLATDYTLSPSPVAAAAGSPYQTLTIPAGQSSLDVVVTPINDTAVEGPETVILELGLDAAYVIAGKASATVTILDDDTVLPKVSIRSGPLDAFENPLRTADFTVARTGATTSALTVNLTFAGTAVNGVDYLTLPATVVIPAGAAATTLAVVPIDDGISEGYETVAATIGTSAAYVLEPAAASATVRIVDDDLQVVSLAVADPVAAEVDLTLPGAVPNPGVFVVSRAGDLTQPLTVYYGLGGTALHGVDFEALPGSVMIPAGQTRASVVISPRFDLLGEFAETVVLQLSAAALGNYKLGAVSSGTVTITDAGDVPLVEVLPWGNVREPATAGKFRFAFKGLVSGSLAINYTVSGTATPGVDYTTLPGTVTVVAGATAVAAGRLHSMFLKPDATLWAMGYNANGQLGDGTTTSRSAPVIVGSNVTAVSAGYAHTLFIKADGTLWGMGSNASGQLGDGTTTTKFSPVQLATGVSTAAAGRDHSLFVKTDGTLWVMGSNGYGQLGDGSLTQRLTPVALAVTGVKAVAAAASGWHSLFLKVDGTLWGMGYNGYGQLADGTTTQRTSPVQVATGVMGFGAGQYHTVYVKTDGVVWALGNNDFGQLGDGTTTLRKTAVVVASAVTAVAVGTSHTLLVKSDGTLWAVGNNAGGQLGEGTNTLRNLFGVMAAGVSATAGGDGHSLFIKNGGSLWSTGNNAYGQLGDGTNTTTNLPVFLANDFVDVSVAPIDDLQAEDLETITVTLVPSAAYTTWAPTRAATLWLYDDEQPTVFVDAHTTAGSGLATLAENSTTAGKFYLTRTGATTAALTVNYTMTGTATNGTDYSLMTGVATIPVGSPGVDVGVTPINDTQFEGTETIILTLAPGAYSRAPGSATIYLTDDETSTTTVGFASAGTVLAESAGTVNIPVTLSAAATAPVTVEYVALTAGTTTAVSSGFNSTTPYWVRLSRVGNVFTAARSVDAITWVDYANPLAMPLADPVWIGLAVCGYDGTLATATFDNVTVTPSAAGAFEGRDVGLVAAAGSVSVLNGVYSVSGAGTSLSGSADSFYFASKPIAGNFTFTARVLSSTGSSSNRYAGIMVREDMRSKARAVSVVQRSTTATFNFARTSSAMTAAGAGIDFQLAGGTITFAPGVTSQTIPLTISDDLLPEVTEDVVLTLRNPTGATLSANTQHVVTITDNDIAPLQPSIGFAAATSTADEAAVPLVLVALSKPMVTAVSVTYAVTGGTATAGVDFLLTPGTLTFAAGETIKALPLTLIDDSLVETSETMQIALANPVGATLNSLGTHVLTIIDNDLPIVGIAATIPVATETGTPGQWTLTRSGATTAPLTVTIAPTGTATSGTDFTALAASVTFPIGSATTTLALTPLADALIEGDETVVVSVVAASTYVVGGAAAATVTITDANIATVNVSATIENASETGPTAGRFVVTRTGATTSALTVSYTVTGTASSGTDFAAIGSSVVIPIGASTGNIAVTPVDDAITEGTEYVVLSLSTGTGYGVGPGGFATVAILDNDNPPTVVVINPNAKAVQISPGNGVNLVGLATDDGAPSPLTTNWSKFSGPGVVTFGTPTALATTATFSTNGLYILRLSVTDGQFTVFDEVTVRVGSFAAAEWVDVNLGASATRGGSGQNGNSFTVIGAGTGLTGTTDSAHMVSRQVIGTSSVVARVTGWPAGASADALAGVMMRETGYRGARRAFIGIKPSGAVQWHTRGTINGANTLVAGGTVTFPAWFKLERTGDSLTAWRAPDASGTAGAWVQVGTALTLAALSESLDAGMVASNALVNTRVEVTMDNVELTPAITGAALVAEDMGTGALPGSGAISGSTYTLTGSGSLGDAGFFRFQQYVGDVVVTARLLNHTGSGQSARGGVMVRDVSLDGAPHGMMGIAHYWGGYFGWRNVPGGASSSNYGGASTNPQWVRIIRQGDTITAWKALNTTANTPGTWTQQGATQSFSAGAPIYVGLAVDSSATTTSNTVQLDNYTVVPGNLAPVVSAGAGGTLSGTATVAIAGTVTDDGEPNPPAALTTRWSMVSGPGTVTFGNASAVATTATLSAAGTYRLRLTADDGEASVFADTTFVLPVMPSAPTIVTAPLAQ
ncbi:MAG: hypothetical protein RL077_3610, partial [Verrucomicrobiota bacterium]